MAKKQDKKGVLPEESDHKYLVTQEDLDSIVQASIVNFMKEFMLDLNPELNKIMIEACEKGEAEEFAVNYFEFFMNKGAKK